MYVGAASPESCRVVVTDVDFDFTTVTGTDLSVRRPDGTRVVWAWTLDAATPDQITLEHVFAADGSDVPHTGDYVVTGWLVTATTTRRIERTVFPAVPYL